MCTYEHYKKNMRKEYDKFILINLDEFDISRVK